jgi:hypothetical protein
LGTPENPMSTAEVAAKAHDLIAPSLGDTATNALISAVLAMDSMADIRALRGLVCPAQSAPTA